MNGGGNGLTVGLLSWKAPVTLERTLQSYAAAGLESFADRAFVFFNSISPEDRALAAKYGWEACGTEENLGIWGGMDAIADLVRTKYVLFLQNDCPVATTPELVRAHLREAVALLESGEADLVRLRHRFNQGDGIGWSKLFRFHFVRELDPRYLKYANPALPEDACRDTASRRLMRMLHPGGARRRIDGLIHLERRPEDVLSKWVVRKGRFLIVDSEITNFSEQPFLISKELYAELSAWCKIHRRHRLINGFPVMEHALNSRWWRKRHFKVALCDEGVFTHARWDDSWRSDHVRYNAGLAGEEAGR